MHGLTMSPIFGVLFALAGLALAVLLGLVLYKDQDQKEVSARKSIKIQEKSEPA